MNEQLSAQEAVCTTKNDRCACAPSKTRMFSFTASPNQPLAVDSYCTAVLSFPVPPFLGRESIPDPPTLLYHYIHIIPSASQITHSATTQTH
jgi:hypothetical protein